MKKNENQSKAEGEVKIRRKSTLYSLIAMGAVLLAGVIVLVVLAASGVFSGNPETLENSNSTGGDSTGGDSTGDDPTDGDPTDDEKPTGTAVSYVNPLETMIVINQQGFYYNSTLNCYYEHVGIDISAEVGSEVYCIADGTVEGVYTADILQGTQVVIDHGNGVKSVYSFVEPTESLKTGATVKQGDVIATVAEATGCEYKEGAHLHLEMYVEGVSADPANYLTLSEK